MLSILFPSNPSSCAPLNFGKNCLYKPELSYWHNHKFIILTLFCSIAKFLIYYIWLMSSRTFLSTLILSMMCLPTYNKLRLPLLLTLSTSILLSLISKPLDLGFTFYDSKFLPSFFRSDKLVYVSSYSVILFLLPLLLLC